MLSHALSPYPSTITQKEKQMVLYLGNHLFYSPYNVVQQTTTVTVGNKHVESFSKLGSVVQSESGLTYGPYENQKPFAEVSISDSTIHCP